MRMGQQTTHSMKYNDMGRMLIILAVLVSLETVACYNLDFRLNPKTSIENVDKRIGLFCEADPGNGNKIVSLQISKKDLGTVVSVRPRFTATTGDRVPKRFQAQGKVDNNSGKSYLQVLVTPPLHEDQGEYTCTMYYSDNTGDVKEQSRTQNIVVKKTVDVTDVLNKVNDLEDKVKKNTRDAASMQSEIDRMKKENNRLSGEISRLQNDKKDMSAKLTDLINKEKKQQEAVEVLEKINKSLMDEISRFNTDMTAKMDRINNQGSTLSSIEEANKDLAKKISDLEEKVTQDKEVVAFCVKLKDTQPIVRGEKIKFDVLVSEDGPSGYNKETGVFTAPVAGAYFFYLTLTLTDDGGEIYLTKNNNIDVAAIHTDTGSNSWDQSSVSALINLEKGDEVSVIPWYLYGSSPVVDNADFTVFGGYLVH